MRKCERHLGLIFVFPLFILLAGVASVLPAQADPMRLMTLNLHGYHPMHEPPRYLQDRNGVTKAADSYVTYFPIDSVYRGHRKQMDELSQALSTLSPDVLFFQEVGAGTPESSKSCDDFYADIAGDGDGKNSALRIRDRLNAAGSTYSALLACRGNIGWQTDPNTFSKTRVVQMVKVNGVTTPQVVFDFGANPYPNGIIVEGTAMLVRAPWTATDHRVLHLPIPGTNETFLLQTAKMSKVGQSGWYLIANLHGGFKQHHFEDAMAVRRELGRYLASTGDLANYRGMIIGGDFNAELYRPSNNSGDLFAVPWEVSLNGEFDYASANAAAFSQLNQNLWAINTDPTDTWGELGSSPDDQKRIQFDVSSFQSFVLEPAIVQRPIRDTLWQAEEQNACRPSGVLLNYHPSCYRDGMIDHIFLSPELSLRNSTIVFSDDNWKSLEGFTDHAGLVTDVDRATSTIR